MFISYEYQKYLGYDEKTKEHSYQYKIIDSDFEGVGVGVGGGVGAGVVVVVALINVYEERNLSVAPNLALLFQYLHEKYKYKISYLIKYNKKYNKKYMKYADEVEKYMVWL